MMGIKNMEQGILKKAKLDQKKVEENKKRFRNVISQASAQVINNLRHYSQEKIKSKISQLHTLT